MNINKLILKLENEIKELQKTAEKEYNKSYNEMYECYLKNSYAVNYHISVSYIEAKSHTLNQIKRGLND